MSDKIRILFLAANSSESNRSYLEREVRAIQNSIHSGGDYRDSFEVIPKLAVRPQDLPAALLRHNPHVVHFSGQGTEADGMVLTDERPDSKAVPSHALAGLLKILKDEIKVVVFNACFAQEQAAAVTEIVDFTIGMSGLIEEQARIAFSAAFYQALTSDRSVADAFNLAQNQLLLQQHESFQVPVLMTRAGAQTTGFVTSTLKQDASTSALVEHVRYLSEIGARDARFVAADTDGVWGGDVRLDQNLYVHRNLEQNLLGTLNSNTHTLPPFCYSSAKPDTERPACSGISTNIS